MDHPQAVVILILGLSAWVFCALTGPVAWFMGNQALREIDAQPGRYGNRTMVQVGRIAGMVMSFLLILGVLAAIALLLVLIASSP